MKFALLLVEIMMDKDKLRCLLLLDLCAFSASLSGSSKGNEVMKNFELAYSLAESHALSARHSYRDFMNRL